MKLCNISFQKENDQNRNLVNGNFPVFECLTTFLICKFFKSFLQLKNLSRIFVRSHDCIWIGALKKRFSVFQTFGDKLIVKKIICPCKLSANKFRVFERGKTKDSKFCNESQQSLLTQSFQFVVRISTGVKSWSQRILSVSLENLKT